MPVRGLPFQILASLDALVDVLYCTVPALDVPLVEHLQMPVRGLPFQILASLDALVDVCHCTVLFALFQTGSHFDRTLNSVKIVKRRTYM